jgi:hypothetical protein
MARETPDQLWDWERYSRVHSRFSAGSAEMSPWAKETRELAEEIEILYLP